MSGEFDVPCLVVVAKINLHEVWLSGIRSVAIWPQVRIPKQLSMPGGFDVSCDFRNVDIVPESQFHDVKVPIAITVRPELANISLSVNVRNRISVHRPVSHGQGGDDCIFTRASNCLRCINDDYSASPLIRKDVSFRWATLFALLHVNGIGPHHRTIGFRNRHAGNNLHFSWVNNVDGRPWSVAAFSCPQSAVGCAVAVCKCEEVSSRNARMPLVTVLHARDCSECKRES
mmetsp:Transcript_11861/g.22211  ORF Transcript_11861/g.22211 Transcript_11861/m.22211 type:complete len:230 (-) Transcript_11861:75-764(-)